ncbi:unnamed protein product [Ostreobium quekettii]|uniref:Uncharacterized protein n=1 Tax=Ostreobium quekettii TaxID=121088 RepID=A0A8S1JB35_9CHLO|nr:unnamed protein product [Ostreobium quekettii]
MPPPHAPSPTLQNAGLLERRRPTLACEWLARGPTVKFSNTLTSSAHAPPPPGRTTLSAGAEGRLGAWTHGFCRSPDGKKVVNASRPPARERSKTPRRALSVNCQESCQESKRKRWRVFVKL